MKSFEELFFKSLTSPLSKLLDLSSVMQTSYFLEMYPIQDPFRYRCRTIALKAAYLLIDDRGEIHSEGLFALKAALEEGPFFTGPEKEADHMIFSHLKRCVFFMEKKEMEVAIRKLFPPVCHKGAEKIIRETLWPHQVQTIQAVDIRRAVVAAWLTVLRQATGSCFATAPAIFIQKNSPLQFFEDLTDLLFKGQIKRVFSGREFTVPLNLSSSISEMQKEFVGLENSIGIKEALFSVGVEISSSQKEKKSPEAFLKEALLKEYGLTEEDLEEEKNLARTQMLDFFAKQGGVYYQPPTEREQKVAKWKKEFSHACTTFQTFTDCALLRAWEYSIASLCDVKTDFARWNLFIGLGIHPDEAGGIGAFIYQYINQKLKECNRQIEELTKEYEELYHSLKALDVMMRNAYSELQRSQIEAQAQSKNMQMQAIVERREEMIEQAEALSNFFVFLIEQYHEKFQQYFQEMFDPKIRAENGAVFEDSYAGFRLFYKHGRLDALHWSPIEDANGYIESLRDFFIKVERDLEVPKKLDPEFVEKLTTALVQFIQSDLFLQTAIKRSIAKGRISPWEYVSGGTLKTLLEVYFGSINPLKQIHSTPHSPEELYQFLLFNEKKEEQLMNSPTHAFLFCPSKMEKIAPFTKELQTLSPSMWQHLSEKLSQKLLSSKGALYTHQLNQKQEGNLSDFRKNAFSILQSEIPSCMEIIDSFLFESTPLFPFEMAGELISKISTALSLVSPRYLPQQKFFGPYEIYQLLQMQVLQVYKTPFSTFNWDLAIVKEMQKEQIYSPITIFADTNWSGWLFGFTFHPIDQTFGLWRVNHSGSKAVPMADWQQFLDETNQSEWTLFSNPGEYLR